MLVVLENARSEEGETLGRWVPSAVLGLVSGSRGEREARHPAHVLRELSETVSGQGRCLKSTLATPEGQKASEARAQLSEAGRVRGTGAGGVRRSRSSALGSVQRRGSRSRGLRATAPLPSRLKPRAQLFSGRLCFGAGGNKRERERVGKTAERSRRLGVGREGGKEEGREEKGTFSKVELETKWGKLPKKELCIQTRW